jgi:hypothetical protein
MVRARLTLMAAGILVAAGLIPVSSIPGTPVPAAALSAISLSFNCEGAEFEDSQSTPAAAAGVLALTASTTDGTGTGSGIETIHVGDVVTGPVDFTATYKLGPDGSFTTTWTYTVDSRTFTQHFFGGLISKGTDFRTVETDTDFPLECTAQTQ